MAKLEALVLCETRVTDRGLQHLRHLRALNAVFLENTGVTDEGVGSLKASLPRCDVFR
jgi:hypothetical protein